MRGSVASGMTLDRFRRLCLAQPGATEQIQWGVDAVFKVGGKMFAVACTDHSQYPNAPVCSFKCDPETFGELVEHEDVIPAPYLARAKWVAMTRWSALPDKAIAAHVARSYALVRAGLPKKVQAALALVCALLAGVVPSAAQDGLLVDGQFYSAVRSFGQPLGPGPARLSQSQVFNGQRYALIGAAVFDGRSGAEVLRVAEPVAALDEARPRVFVWRDDTIWTVQIPSGVDRRIWSGGQQLRLCAYAYSVDVLYCQSVPQNGVTEVLAVDVGTGRARVVVRRAHARG